MRVKKIFNNNVILTEDDKQQEIVVMGRGLAFQKKIGDEIDETKIEKTFTIHSKGVSDKLSQLLEEIPLEHFELSNDIIELAKKELGCQLNESIYLSLTDHLHFVLTRIQEGLIIKNALLWEVKKFYKDEYEVAKQAIGMIEERTGIRIPEDESASIALHLFNARQDSVGMEQTMVMTKIVNDIITIVKYHFGITFDEDSMNYSRFITHLRYFGYRIQRGELSQEGDDSLFDQVIKQYPEAYQCTLKVQTYLQLNYHVKMTKDEMVYFMIHIHRVSNREKKA
ncbi:MULTISPECIES: BglG family transcription antiterminator LicT [Bacillaceae]|uniref:Beta-glucoside operon transcriptional antiterminator n=1 Tax=Peribacillus huizhouensis TaxID=1501239 RepID=A0ABR6CN04_9BACI|nr:MULTISPECIES: PRD domain-containing protein [Bacillaceae]MBA9026429.1 beta-glucoside operon transcriptional antiterminator [Peribacillus huizhouensis]